MDQEGQVTQESRVMATSRRKPWVAAVLSFFAPGLGQIYAGQAKKGIFLGVLWVLLVGAGLSIARLFPLFSRPQTIVAFVCFVVIMVFSVGVYAFAIFDAARIAHRQADAYQLQVYNKWYLYIAIVIIVSIAGGALRDEIQESWFKAYKIPSGAMIPTLLPGDYIMVDKAVYRKRFPERGDIIIFKFPEDETKDFIKRVIGLPGETIEIRDKQVWINENLLSEPYTQYVDPSVLPHQMQPRDNLGPLTVPPESYFVMGDNRDQSLDSRFWGFVKVTKIRGQASFIYWSWDSRQSGARWNRLGLLIR